jgi:hypothetical protein
MSPPVNEAAARAGAADRERTTGTTKVVSLAAARARVKSDEAPSIRPARPLVGGGVSAALSQLVAEARVALQRRAARWKLSAAEVAQLHRLLADVLTARGSRR